MQTQRVNRSDAEKVFIVVKNVDSTTVTTGNGVRYVGGTAAEIASTDGVNAVKASSINSLFAGIAAEDIPSNGYGRVQAWGYVPTISISAEADKTIGVTGVANSYLKMSAVAGSFTSTQTEASLTTSAYKYVQNFTTVNISGGTPTTAGFVRAL
jgi:hypothetical protein